MSFLESLKRAERFASNDRRGRSMQNGENGVNQSAARLYAPDIPPLYGGSKTNVQKKCIKGA